MISAPSKSVTVVLIFYICDLGLTPDNSKNYFMFYSYEQVAAVSLTYYELLSVLTGEKITG